jgi:FixJ family two-component response regulator
VETKPIIDIVEDDEAMSRALTSLVGSFGYQTRCYGTAQQYLAAAVADQPACLILDVRLPGTSGLDLQEELLEAGTAPPIIFITGHGDAHAAQQAMARGAAAFLEKPFPSEELAAAIRKAIGGDEQQ